MDDNQALSQSKAALYDRP